MSPVLEIEKLSKDFNGIKAVQDFSLSLKKGSIVGLIGPNGAGKTTVFNVLTGLYKPTSGKVTMLGRDITGLRPDIIAAGGIARTFQNLRLFKRLSVIENVLIGSQINKRYGFLAVMCSLPAFAKEEQFLYAKAMGILDNLGLAGEAHHPAGSLPYGSQRKLEIARALATNPKILLLDEPAAGMNPSESTELIDTIRQIRDKFDLTVLLIEHDMRVVMSLCEHIQVLSYGKVIARGQPAHIQSDPQVIEAYLGRTASHA